MIVFIPSLSHSGGPVHGAKAAGMGTSFIAVADDPSAILHNPAGLTQVKGTNVYGGNTLLFPTTTYDSPAGEREETEFQVFYPPHFYVSSDLGKENMVFGLGMHTPFGIGGRKWSDTGLTRYLSIESFTGTFTVNPTVAWQVLPNLSVAAGIDYMGAISRAEVRIDQSTLGASDAEQEVDGLGFGWGYNLGLLYFINDMISLGIAYRSEIEIDQSGETTISSIAPALQPLFGGSEFTTDVDTTSVFPQIVSIGIAIRTSDSFTLAFEAEWLEWSSFDEITFDYEDEVPAAGFTDVTMTLDWQDIWLLKAGADYKINERLSLRCGYTYVETPVPDHTLAPSNPDSDQHNFSIGAGYTAGKWTVDIFYNAGFFEDRNVDNEILSGEYENFIHYAGLSVGYRL